MSAHSWTAITLDSPPPAGVPLLVRIEQLGALPSTPAAVLTVPMMWNGKRWRHINLVADDPLAWLDPRYRATHWQRYPSPQLPAPLYAVIERSYLDRGEVLIRARAGGLSFEAAQADVAAWRAAHREDWARFPHGILRQREFFPVAMSLAAAMALNGQCLERRAPTQAVAA